MPLESNLNVAPYFDDYNEQKEFYKILFKPGVSVQTRELNQLQTILQNQIERFGDHIFKSGTIVSGVNFAYHPNYSYIKIRDDQGDGQPSIVSAYKNYFLKSNLNLISRVVDCVDGLETKDPDLKTLYLQYQTSSDPDTSNSNVRYVEYANNDVLTVYSKSYPIFKNIVVNGGQAFSNSDSVVILSALTVNDNTAAFAAGETITQSTTSAQAVIVSVNATAIADAVILQIKPRNQDLANTSLSISQATEKWTFQSGYNITSTGGATANVTGSIGSGATGFIVTDSLGIVQRATITNGGSDYTHLPTVTIKTGVASATVSDIDIQPQNFLTTISVSNVVNSVGTGYAFGVTSGIVYQKGYFVRVDPQTIIINKYGVLPNNVVVGFKTQETSVNSNQDDSLFDNAANTTNYSAPGADRLQLSPVLYTQTTEQAAANVDFFALVEWREGHPYKENRVTNYNTLAAEFERRTDESAGNYVIDPFVTSTVEKNIANNTFTNLIVDPGTAYISGKRVQTLYNTVISLPRSATTTSVQNRSFSLNYGNYITIKEVGGTFNFTKGDLIELHSTAVNFVSNGLTTIASPGTKIGSARIRSWVVDEGIVGTKDCTYRLYLFDVQMEAGKNFRNVASVYYDDPATTMDAVADVVRTFDSSSNTNITKIVDPLVDQAIFGLKAQALKAVDNVNYTIRTVSNSSLQIGTNGTVDLSLSTGSEFPYSTGLLTNSAKKDFLVVPLANVITANITSTNVVSNSLSKTISCTGTTLANGYLQAGDYVKLSNSSASIYGQVESVANNTHFNLTSNASANAESLKLSIFFPANHPIPIASREPRTIDVANSTSLTMDFKATLDAAANVVITFNKTTIDQQPSFMTVQRNVVVKLHTSNNVANNVGPWCLGVPNVIRLNGVYIGNSSTVNSASTNYGKYFFVDANHDQNAYRLSNLVLQQNAPITLSNDAFIAVDVDVLKESGAGHFSISSYTINDTVALGASNSINTLEIPEGVTTTGKYFDARDIIDFRPYAINTANLVSNSDFSNTNITVNPSNTFNISSVDQLWPAPDSTFSCDIEFYNRRKDRVSVNRDGSFVLKTGAPGYINVKPVPSVADELDIGIINVPPYPSLPVVLSENTRQIASKKVGNAKSEINTRVLRYTTSTSIDSSFNTQTPQRYSMKDIKKLEKRLEAVEYHSLLSRVETQVQNKIIPSAVDPRMDRFKHGFFAEPFNDQNFLDVTNDEYQATIDFELGVLKPPTRQINFESKFNLDHANTAAAVVGENNSTLMLPFEHYMLISQPIKTAAIASVGSDGQPVVVYHGEGTISPPTFSIKLRGVVDQLPDQPTPGVTGGGSCSGSCFTGNTLVSLADGSTKQIKDVVVGDLVWNATRTEINVVTLVEKASAKWFDSIYSPLLSVEPFATLDHPLFVDGQLTAPVINVYKWLNVKQLDEQSYRVANLKDDCVYNLWLTGDSTYIVNGIGTTSIIGNGGLATIAVNNKLATQEEISDILHQLTAIDSNVTYGIYLINKYLGTLDISYLAKIMLNIIKSNKQNFKYKSFIVVMRMIGRIANVFKS